MQRKGKKEKIDYDPECMKEYRTYERKGRIPIIPNKGGITDIIDELGGRYSKNDEGNEYLNNYKLPLSTLYNRMDKMPSKDWWPLICPIKIDEEKLRKMGGLKLEDWINKVKKNNLTIKDFLKMKPQQKIKMLTIHRNFRDLMDPLNLKRGKLYNPKFAFRNNIDIFIKSEIGTTNELRGKLIFPGLQDENEDFELHIEYMEGRWYPLINGYLPAHGERGLKLLGKKMHWSEFPKNTCIGWRGPFIPWSTLDNMMNTKVFTNDEPFDNWGLEIAQKRLKNGNV